MTSTSAPRTDSSSQTSSAYSPEQQMTGIGRIVSDWKQGYLSTTDALGAVRATLKLGEATHED